MGMASFESKSEKPKRTLNPIIKEMNAFRNNVIGEHIGSKAPIKTAPIFKFAIAAARSDMGLEEKEKNTIEVVSKASSLFQEDPEKYVSLAASQPAEPKAKKEKKTKTKSKDDEEKVTKKTPSKGIKKEVAPVEKTPAKTAKTPAKTVKKEVKPTVTKKKNVKEVVKPTVT